MSACLTYLSLDKSCVDDSEMEKMMTDFTNCAKELGQVEGAPQHWTLVTPPALQVSALHTNMGKKLPLLDHPLPPLLL